LHRGASQKHGPPDRQRTGHPRASAAERRKHPLQSAELGIGVRLPHPAIRHPRYSGRHNAKGTGYFFFLDFFLSFLSCFFSRCFLLFTATSPFFPPFIAAVLSFSLFFDFLALD